MKKKIMKAGILIVVFCAAFLSRPRSRSFYLLLFVYRYFLILFLSLFSDLFLLLFVSVFLLYQVNNDA